MRSNRSVKHVAVASLLIVAATVALASGVSAAPSVEHWEHCNNWNVKLAFWAWITGHNLWERGFRDNPLAKGYGLCQYRLFGGAYGYSPVCFCEDDYFFGGNTAFQSIGEPPEGMPWSEAREWLNQMEYEVKLDGEELDIAETFVMWGRHDTLGEVAWKQHGVFFQLPPGDYLSTYRQCHPEWGSDPDEACDPDGDGWWPPKYVDPFTTLVRVLPHEVAHELGPPDEAHRGSVKCPEE